MARRAGSRFDRGLALPRVDRSLGRQGIGSYRTSDRTGGTRGTGGTTYPSVLEAYNRDSDYKRWLEGKRYFQGSGSGWADSEISYLIRTFRDFGSVSCGQLNTFTLFPSSSSPEGAWTVVNRRRGAFVVPGPISAQDIEVDQRLADPQGHRLLLDVSSRLSPAQLAEWQVLVGDQFEDSAALTPAGVRLIDSPDGVVAFTLVAVDLAAMKLVFDITRPYLRVRADPAFNRGYWRRARYRVDAPLRWRADGTRLLCSSHRFHCSCPDFSGTSTANILGGGSGSQELFPRPAAGRTTTGQWEESALGYRRRWRDLPRRADRRRECKHIHAVRWARGYPFFEPDDYPIGDDERQFMGDASPVLGDAALSRYQGRRQIQLDQAVIPLADSGGVLIDSRNIIPPDEEVPTRPDRQPILWTSLRPPPPGRARTDDWWLKRGTNELLVYDPVLEQFVASRLEGGERQPLIQQWPDGKLVPMDCGGPPLP